MKSLYQKLLWVGLVVVLVVIGYQWQHRRDPLPRQSWEEAPETSEQKLVRWQNEAAFEMLKDCTNRITGLAKIIRVGVDDARQPTVNWKGGIIAEYVNHVGGVDRTNLYYTFAFISGHVSCYADSNREDQERIRALTAK